MSNLPVGELLGGEPEVNLVLGRVGAIGSVDDVAANEDGVVSADGSGGRVSGVGGSEHLASGEDRVLALPNHGDNGSRGEVLDERGEELSNWWCEGKERGYSVSSERLE